MKTLDITFDLETTAICPTAAVLAIGAVVWDRDGKSTPFFPDEVVADFPTTFNQLTDLNRQFIDGFTFDQSTAEWWSRQSDKAKGALLEPSCDYLDIECAVHDFIDWIKEAQQHYQADEVCLWCQGSDFDIAILRNICEKYGLVLPVNHTNFRDHRTFFLEGARIICDIAHTDYDPKKAYSLVEPYEGEGCAHEPLYDCKRSIFSTWQMMNHLRCLTKKENCN